VAKVLRTCGNSALLFFFNCRSKIVLLVSDIVAYVQK